MHTYDQGIALRISDFISSTSRDTLPTYALGKILPLKKKTTVWAPLYDLLHYYKRTRIGSPKRKEIFICNLTSPDGRHMWASANSQ